MLDDKVNKMIEDNINLVPYVVHKNFKTDIAINPSLLDEYISVGNLALIKACKGFDENKGFQFATYAISIIWGEIQKFRRYGRNAMRIPARLHKAGTEYGKGINENKNIDEICEETGISRKDIEEWLAAKTIVNLDAPLQDSEGSSFTRLDMLTDECDIEKSVVEDIRHKEKMEILENILTPIEFKIVKLIESGVYKQGDLAEKMNLSQSYISRILKNLTGKVGPAVEEYYSGEISWSELCKKLKVKENQTNILIKDLEVLGMKKFEKEVNVLCKWLIDNPGEQLNMAEELKHLGISKSNISYYRGTIRDKIIEKMKSEGYDIQEVPFGKGTRLVLEQPVAIKEETIISSDNSITTVEKRIEISEDILLDISDIPLKDYNLAFAESLQKSLSMFNTIGKSAVLDIKVREVS